MVDKSKWKQVDMEEYLDQADLSLEQARGVEIGITVGQLIFPGLPSPMEFYRVESGEYVLILDSMLQSIIQSDLPESEFEFGKLLLEIAYME